MIPQAVAHQAPLSMGFPRQEHWSGYRFPPPGALPDPGTELGCPALAGGFFTPEPPGKPIAIYTQLIKLFLEIISQHRYTHACSPQHLLLPLQSGCSQPSLPPPPARKSECVQTGHMDNHLELITYLCHRDGPLTSGSDNFLLLPPPSPETFYQMLQEKIQPGQHRSWSVTQLCRLTPGNKPAPGRRDLISVWSCSMIQG